MNNMGDKGAEAVSDMLLHNDTLLTLNISGTAVTSINTAWPYLIPTYTHPMYS